MFFFLKNNILLWQNIDNKLYHFNHFKMHSTFALKNSFTLFSYHHYYPPPEISHHLKLKLCTYETLTPQYPSPQPWGPVSLLAIASLYRVWPCLPTPCPLASGTIVLFLNFDLGGEALLLAHKMFIYFVCLHLWVSLHSSAFTACLYLSLIFSLPCCFEHQLHNTFFLLPRPLSYICDLFPTLWIWEGILLSTCSWTHLPAPHSNFLSFPECSSPAYLRGKRTLPSIHGT